MVSVYGVKLLDELRFLEMKGLLQACLPREVCTAASAMKHPAAMQRKVLGELLLRSIINKNHSITSDSLKIAYTDKNKPYLASHPHIHFNISHSGDWVVIAFSENHVGVDVEKVRKINLNIARRFFSNEEKTRLFRLHEKDQMDYFFDLWTLKESFLKAIGTGLTRPLKTFTVLQSASGFYLEDDGDYEDIRLNQLPVGKNYKLSVCSFGEEPDGEFHKLYINDMLELMRV